MTIYAVVLSKGGSTKTTTAAEIVSVLTGAGRKVLALDLDQQGNLSTRMGLTPDSEVVAVAADVLLGDSTLEQAAVASPSVAGAWVVAGTHDLSEIDTQKVPDLVTALRDQSPQLKQWDDVVIDTPPNLAGVTLTALATADVVVAAVACEVEAYDQLGRLQDVITHQIARRVKPGQRVHWVVPTRHDSRRSLDREVMDLLQEKFPGQVTTPVREAVAVRDAYTAGMPVSVFAPGSPVAKDYQTALAPVIATSVEGNQR